MTVAQTTTEAPSSVTGSVGGLVTALSAASGNLVVASLQNTESYGKQCIRSVSILSDVISWGGGISATTTDGFTAPAIEAMSMSEILVSDGNSLCVYRNTALGLKKAGDPAPILNATNYGKVAAIDGCTFLVADNASGVIGTYQYSFGLSSPMARTISG